MSIPARSDMCRYTDGGLCVTHDARHVADQIVVQVARERFDPAPRVEVPRPGGGSIEEWAALRDLSRELAELLNDQGAGHAARAAHQKANPGREYAYDVATHTRRGAACLALRDVLRRVETVAFVGAGTDQDVAP